MALPHFNSVPINTPNELYDGQLTFDSLTNTITTFSNGQTITIDPTASVTYTGASSGDYLMYDNSNVQWSINTFMIFDNDELSIDFNGNIEIDGKKEVNPSKIGLALLRAIESKLEASKKTDTITDICDV